jgi:hypothetical protein
MTTPTDQPPVVYATSLETAKEGEIVAHSRAFQRDWNFVIITRTTPTMIFVNSRKFDRDGREKGSMSALDRGTIKVTNAEEHQAAKQEDERKDLARRFKESVGWDRMTLDQLRQVSALCLSFQPKS